MEQKDGSESGIETWSFFFPQERTSVCKPHVGGYLKGMSMPPIIQGNLCKVKCYFNFAKIYVHNNLEAFPQLTLSFLKSPNYYFFTL